jgi:hypothetical protein
MCNVTGGESSRIDDEGGGLMRRYLRALVYDLDPRPVELLTAQLSIWFCLVLITSSSVARPLPWWLWSAWCGTAAALKIAGVLPTLVRFPPYWWTHWARAAGCLMGLTFWVVLATVLFLLAPYGISWGGYAVVAFGQAWCFFRLTRRVR